MAALTKQTPSQVGTVITFAAASSGGDTVASPSVADVLLVKNDDAASRTVTIAVPGTEWNNQAKPDTTVTVNAGVIVGIRLDPRYANTGVASITYSAVTNVSVAVLTV